MDRDALIERLAAMLTERESEPTTPSWTDPAKYPQAQRIDDPAILERVHEYEALANELEKLDRRMRARVARIKATSAELFDVLEEAYPHVRAKRDPGAGTGFREHEGTWYYVGWGQAEVDALRTSPRGATESKDVKIGQYL